MENKKKTNKKFTVIIFVLVLVLGTFGAIKIIHSFSHEDTDDAQIMENMNAIIPHVGGYIDKIYVKDNQKVKKGDTLFTIDQRDYQIKKAQAEANLAAVESQLAVSEASIGSYQANTEASKAQVTTATETITSAKIQLWRAQNDFDRYNNLYENKSITKQQFEKALAAKQEAENHLKVLEAQKVGRSSNLKASQAQTIISQKQVAVAEANVKSALAMVNAAQLNLDYTIVTAPNDGELSTVNILGGQFVQPGQSLFYLINSDKKWVVANFKETQLEKMEIGQEVEIVVDAYPSNTFKGVIATFSPATGARFSLLPPDNATGNFVKTIQRLPVKITFTKDNDEGLMEKLKSGMNADIDVHLK